MRVNKYKISKKRRLRRRGKYSKKLKTKSRKSGGRFPFLGHVKNKVQIRATCEIPGFFFTSHDLFYDIMGLSEEFRLRKTGYGEPGYGEPGIDISVYGGLLKKNKTADSYTLSVKLDSLATIDDVYFNILQGHDIVTTQGMRDGEKKLNIDVTDSMIFNVKKVHNNYNVLHDGKGGIFSTAIKRSEYEATESEEFVVVHDTDDRILKLLLHLWRKKYTDPRLKLFDVFFSDFCTQYPSIVTQFREHEYRFKVKRIILSSS